MRLYEELGLIPKPLRKPNGYRIFRDIHIDQLKLARKALQIEVLQGGLRKQIIKVVKLSANRKYNEAISLTKDYICLVEDEIKGANEAVEIANTLINGGRSDNNLCLKRKDAADLLGVTMDTLRNWEMNGLIKIKRKENGYRVYDGQDIQKLKMIRSLRCANYSLTSILRMMNAFSEGIACDVKDVLNTPNQDEDIISVCDKLIVSLGLAKDNANHILQMLYLMKNKYSNPPL